MSEYALFISVSVGYIKMQCIAHTHTHTQKSEWESLSEKETPSTYQAYAVWVQFMATDLCGLTESLYSNILLMLSEDELQPEPSPCPCPSPSPNMSLSLGSDYSWNCRNCQCRLQGVVNACWLYSSCSLSSLAYCMSIAFCSLHSAWKLSWIFVILHARRMDVNIRSARATHSSIISCQQMLLFALVNCCHCCCCCCCCCCFVCCPVQLQCIVWHLVLCLVCL